MLTRNQDGRQHRFKDAPASESPWDIEPDRGGSVSPGTQVGGRREDAPSHAPALDTPPAAERPASPPEADAERGPQPIPQENKPADKPRKGWVRRHPFLSALGLVTLLFITGAGYLYWNYTGHFESTDDAYIAARQYSIAPEVSGYLTAVPVTDNQHVVTGQVIARIDDRQYRIALAQAEAQVAQAQDNIGSVDAQIAQQQAAVAQAQAQVQQAQAGLVFAQQQATRYGTLAHTGFGSIQDAQQYSSQLRQQQATLKTTQASLTAAQRQIDVLKAQRTTDEANLAQANAERDQAALNLSYTTVTAAEPGRVAELSAGVGEYVTAGTSLSMFVPDDIWVSANFKETQVDHMRPGQPATIVIDAYPDRVIKGHVASVQPGSGTAFSLLPAENATGNWVKIVQRVPVKIVMDNPPTDVALGPGMSVNATVRLDPNPSLYRQLSAWLPSLYERVRARL